MSPRLPSTPGSISAGSSDPDQLRQLISVRETQLGDTIDRADQLQKQLDEVTVQLQTATAAQASAEATLKSLSDTVESQTRDLEQLKQAVDEATTQYQSAATAQAAAEATAKTRSDTVDAQTSELQQLRSTLEQQTTQHQEEIAKLRTEAESRLTETVKSALEQQGAEHKRALDDLRTERDQLQETVKSLQDQVETVREERVTEPITLAEGFAQVLKELAENPPAAGDEAEVNLARLEVEARGVVRAAAKEGDPPEFVTSAPGRIDPAELSTMRMEFRLSPRMPRAADES